jgi:DNA mismatch repair protein MutL
MSIKLLAPQVADAIAAGEVVERPASVVKELIENSLDAGAQRIWVEIRGAGRTLIRIADDGSGISPDELPLAFRRHATSKVAELSDLQAIMTLGFRGEALASLAAVADTECRSQGARIRLRAGDVVEQGAAMPAPGTILEVRDLFAQTPARLKFLRSDATETAVCVKTVHAYALLHPDVRFELSVDGRSVLRTSGSAVDGWLEAIRAVLGREVAAEMRAVSGDRVTGMVSEPRLSRGNRDAILLGVNRRPVASRALSFAIEECYLGALERGRYPIAVLNLEVDPGEVDVNVHPAKREVRFTSERAVFANVQRAVRSALAVSQPYQVPVPTSAASTEGQIGSSAGLPLRPATHKVEGFVPEQQTSDARAFQPGLEQVARLATAAPGGEHWLRPLGQVREAYLVAENGEGIVLIDQHAAHERVLYDRFLERLRNGSAPSQGLLLPEVVEASPAQIAAASDHAEDLRTLGFEVELFGPSTLRLLAGPPETSPESLLAALLELLSVWVEAGVEASRERLAASLACHSAVRFGDPLDLPEQRRLLQEIEAAPAAITCPHGRPTQLLLSWEDLKRHFHRNY